ncbi:MAG: DUF2726 domain-containing protein [Proteobacteria bacterium]|nr:DUF2726 domain-containing protein [Pseudomonadota bacterium]
MDWAWMLALAALVVLATGAARRLVDARPWPVERRPPLSRAEQVLYWRLREACPEYVVLAQVAMAQLLEVSEPARRDEVFNRYRRLVLDFVVCTSAFEVVAVIELDDGRGMTPGRADADARKAAALRAAQVPLLRFSSSGLPAAGNLRSLLIAPSVTAAAAPLGRSAPPAVA